MTLLERDPTAPSEWRGEMPVTNRYTLGVAGERFFRALKDDQRILGSHCEKCERTYVPAAAFCERCLNQTDDWMDVGSVGEVVTFTQLYVNFDGSRRQVPETIALIRLGDGGLIHKLVSPDSVPIEIGMQAKAVFKPPSERAGSILDILYFELIPD